MAITPKLIFDDAMERTEHLLVLYDILHNTRGRRIRADWAKKFKELMHWPSSEKIERVDGLDGNSFLILREQAGIDGERFKHEYLSELLRSALAAAVAAMDRYFHELIVQDCWKVLQGAEEDIPNGLKKLRLPVLATKRALEKLRSDSNARPGSIIKAEIQKVLHREATFQSLGGIEQAAQILGIKKFWDNVSKEMTAVKSKKELRESIQKIAERRNQIVHESDIILQTRARKVSHRDISRAETTDAIVLVKDLVSAVEAVRNA